MKFTDIIHRLLPGGEPWTEEDLADAKSSLDAAGPTFSDLLDEDGAEQAVGVPPTSESSPSATTPSAPTETTPPASGVPPTSEASPSA